MASNFHYLDLAHSSVAVVLVFLTADVVLLDAVAGLSFVAVDDLPFDVAAVVYIAVVVVFAVVCVGSVVAAAVVVPVFGFADVVLAVDYVAEVASAAVEVVAVAFE